MTNAQAIPFRLNTCPNRFFGSTSFTSPTASQQSSPHFSLSFRFEREYRLPSWPKAKLNLGFYLPSLRVLNYGKARKGTLIEAERIFYDEKAANERRTDRTDYGP